MMKASSRCLALLGSALIASSAVASSSAYISEGESSGGCYPDKQGNGACNSENNNAACGFDSGDCCSCTCVSSIDFECGEYGFACIDPDASCVDDDDVTTEIVENCGNLSRIGDGRCQPEYNTEICGFDGGDCCSCTCEKDEWGYGCNEGDFACIDPEAPCVNDDDVTIEIAEGCAFLGRVQDGICDSGNNNELCGYDGGDCCECTCEVSDSFSSDSRWSGCKDFACIDPMAPCVNDDDVTAYMVENCPYSRESIGDGYCDLYVNNEACGYDGGDCCPCTCQPPEGRSCGYWGYACIDPSAECVDEDDITADMVEGCYDLDIWGDGKCNDLNNNELCGFDGGDCCECTCDGDCSGGFACLDPSAPCQDDDFTIDHRRCRFPVLLGNGDCNVENNTPECNFDGGDCCPCTCESSLDYQCGAGGYNCIDPSAECLDDDGATDRAANCSVGSIGNGDCDPVNNKEECAWDGGDCCSCTCVGPCLGFSCIDPSASCVDDDDITVDIFENCGGYTPFMSDGYCDDENNNAECNFDGGDCCPCTCESSLEYECGTAGFNCIDPSVTCPDDEGPTTSYEFTPSWGEDDDYHAMSYWFVPSWEEGDGAVSYDLGPGEQDDDVMSYDFGPWPLEEPLPTVGNAVEVGTKTDVGVTATAYDARPGLSSGDAGCGEAGGDGCAPAKSRDGISNDIESRWSCSPKLVEGNGPCQIEYTFAAPQDIVDIQVAFWKGNERTRTLRVHLNGVEAHMHESYPGPTFNTFGVEAAGVSTVMLESVELGADEWISLIEVLIFVTP